MGPRSDRAATLDFFASGLTAGERVLYVAEHADQSIVHELTRRARDGQFETFADFAPPVQRS